MWVYLHCKFYNIGYSQPPLICSSQVTENARETLANGAMVQLLVVGDNTVDLLKCFASDMGHVTGLASSDCELDKISGRVGLTCSGKHCGRGHS